MTLVRPLPDPLVELVAARFRVLGQPIRVRLLERLELLGEAHVQALADELAATQQNTSKHLGALWRAGLVTRRQEGRVAVYSLVDGGGSDLIEQVATAIAVELRGDTNEVNAPHGHGPGVRRSSGLGASA